MNKYNKNKISANAFKNGMRRYIRRKNRNMVTMKKYRTTISSDILPIKCEECQTVVIANNQIICSYSTGNTFRNAAASIANSNSWASYSPLYSRYKITGLALRVSRIGNDVTTIGSGVSVIPVQFTFYPQYVSTSVANADIVSNDQSFRVDSNVTTIQTRYYKFPDNYFESTGTGFGIWNDISAISTQIGQLSVGNFSIGYTAVGDKVMYQIRIVYYVQLGYKRQ